MGKNQEDKSNTIHAESSDALEFPTDFAEAVAKIQATAMQGGKDKPSSSGEKVFLSMNDLYLARSG